MHWAVAINNGSQSLIVDWVVVDIIEDGVFVHGGIC